MHDKDDIFQKATYTPQVGRIARCGIVGIVWRALRVCLKGMKWRCCAGRGGEGCLCCCICALVPTRFKYIYMYLVQPFHDREIGGLSVPLASQSMYIFKQPKIGGEVGAHQVSAI